MQYIVFMICTIGTQRWVHANLWWISNGNGGGAEEELTCKVGRHVSYIIPLSFKILDTSSTLPLYNIRLVWRILNSFLPNNFFKKGGWSSNSIPLSLSLNLHDNARSKSSRCGLLNPFSDGANFGGKSLRGLLSSVSSSNKVKTKL